MKPLEDVRVIAVEQFGAGPFGSLQLADLGADVVKIEDPRTGGDIGRYVPPFQDGEESLFFESFNRNKRSLSLDLTTEAGQRVLHDLVRTADVVYSNLRGDVPGQLGLTYDDLKQYNPQIVCCSLSGFGMVGSRAAEPAYDYILQGMVGWMELTGEPDGPPVKTGLSLVDLCGGLTAAISVLAAVHAARRDGVGMDCDLALFDAALAMYAYVGAFHLTAGFEPVRTRNSAHPTMVPFQNFPTSDGWIVLGCAKEKFWVRLVEAVGLPELATDPRFVDFAARREHAAEVLKILSDVLLTRTTAEWLAVFTPAGVPSGPVNDVVQAFRDPLVAERSMVVETEHPHFETVRQVNTAVRVGKPKTDHKRAPQRHENSTEILGGLLGYSPGEVRALSDAGAFGAVDTPYGQGS